MTSQGRIYFKGNIIPIILDTLKLMWSIVCSTFKALTPKFCLHAFKSGATLFNSFNSIHTFISDIKSPYTIKYTYN